MSDTNHCMTRMTLLAKLKDQHNDAAWSDFVYYYRQFIYNIARRMGLGHDDAGEIVQIVLIQSWNKLPDFQYDPGKGRFRGWLCRITGNAVKNYLRDHINRFVELDPDAHLSELMTPPETEKIADEEWRSYVPKLAWKNIEGHFDSNVRQTYAMLAEGKSVAEIAERLGIKHSSVYVYRKRIQDKLRVEVKRLEHELG
ncbi:MAG: sigma-70 family RNA polymerase sigma factor [Victivallales bacterium]|nr:sigma-70 family RNA polymerase sigma factor [Victivallales bacterium]